MPIRRPREGGVKALRFGVYLNLYYHPTGDPAGHAGRGTAVMAEAVEQARLCEQAGFDWIVLGERHLHPTGYHEVITSLAWLGAHTHRIGLATAGIILPVYPPLFLAESLAHIDVLTGGRLTVGVVLGYRAEEFEAFHVSPGQRRGRFEEALEIIKRLWAGEQVSYRGRHFALQDAFLSVRPVQQPRPRLWNGGRVQEALERTARECDGWTTSFNEEPEELASKIAFYRSLPASEGSLGREVVVLREGFCAPSSQQARRILEGPLLDLYRLYAGWKAGSIDAGRYQRLEWEALASRMVVGSPEECVEQLAAYRAMGADAVVLRLQAPGLAHRDVMACIELLGDRVLPAVRTP